MWTASCPAWFRNAASRAGTGSVEITLAERERFADPQSGSPEENDRCTEPVAVWAITDGPHDRDDLLDGRWVGGIVLTFGSWWAALVVAAHRRGRAAVAGGVESYGLHHSTSCC